MREKSKHLFKLYKRFDFQNVLTIMPKEIIANAFGADGKSKDIFRENDRIMGKHYMEKEVNKNFKLYEEKTHNLMCLSEQLNTENEKLVLQITEVRKNIF